MSERILGIDTGTNSLGWAVVDYDERAQGDKYHLIDKGVNIFSEGVKIEEDRESSRAAERTEHRRHRLNYYRRKIRKIALLKLLSENGLCPPLGSEELKAWRLKKVYPCSKEFMEWQRTDDKENKNPYYYRNLCLTETLDLNNRSNRYIVGRALYHLNQRRGFLSNRKEETKESDGAVNKGINALTEKMQKSGCQYLGEYFYLRYKNGEKIRKEYTDRLGHYREELLAICKKQGLGESLTERLLKVIILQRPLKSQKHSVGKCVFEPQKPRCPISHPLFEQYRMYSFINGIRLQGPDDAEMRPLTSEEKKAIVPLFLRKSKKDFQFKEIASKLSGTKNNFCYYKDKSDKDYKFNYHEDNNVSSCPVTAQLSAVFETGKDVDEWLGAACEVYTQGEGKTRLQIMNDIWHALFFFSDSDKLKEFAYTKLQLDGEHAEAFSKIKVPSDYASLSLKAVRKILPYMKHYGMKYSHAVFLANIPAVTGRSVGEDAMLPKEDVEDLMRRIAEYNPEITGIRTLEEYLKGYITWKYKIPDGGEKVLDKLYHPSMIETFPEVLRPTEEGYFQLSSPRTSSLRNPMAMHSLFRLRHVVNTLLKEGKIDKDTTIRIEFARELNDANKRAALRAWQRERENENKEYAKKIKEHFGENYEPTDEDILRYRLWEEQDHICLYTGEKIALSDLFDGNKYDIEHTVPRSKGGDSTEMNLTICQSRFNREIKRAIFPIKDLPSYELIMERIERWKKEYEDIAKQIRKLNTRGLSDKDAKDRIIQKRHLLKLKYDYWWGKYTRFTMESVPEGFSRSQGVGIGVISKYARLFLKTVFPKVYVVKGLATSDFRKIWGLQEEYDKKQRANHCHHAIDAITIACIGKAEYDYLAQYYGNEEKRRWGLDSRRAFFPKPWATFTEDVKNIGDSLLISHYKADNIAKHTRKKVRKAGKFTGEYMQGDTARGVLHLDTYYGAIKRDDCVRYVVRRPLDSLGEKAVESIVDDAVREKVKAAVSEHGSLKEAVKAGIWMNRDKNVKINKVRVYANDVKHPLTIRKGKQRDLSKKEYKQGTFVKNDTVYSVAIYEGLGENGKISRKAIFHNTLDVAALLKQSGENHGQPIIPKYYPESDLELKHVLKIGTLVLMYENSEEEVYEDDRQGLRKRLYKVYGLASTNDKIKLIHHQEARRSKDLDKLTYYGAYRNEGIIAPRIWVSTKMFRALVQGWDFEINDIGEIKFLRR